MSPIDLQDLRRRLYVKAKAETSWRCWGLYVHVCKMETLRQAYALAKDNDGAPGVDGVTFEAIEARRSSSRSGTNWFSAPTSHYRLGGRRYRRTGEKSASFRFRPSVTGWC